MIVLWLLACAPSPTDTSEAGAPAGLPLLADAGPDLRGLVGAPVTLDGSRSQGEGFSWDLGDGAQASGAVVSHTYATPGEYPAVLTVSGSDGAWKSDVAVVTVTAPETAVQPVWSRTMTHADGLLWVVNPEAGSLGVVDAISGSLREEIPVCAGPRTLAAGGGVVAVACEQDAQLVLIDQTTRSISTTVPLPEASRPFGVAGRDGIWWVSLQATGQLARWDGAALDTIAVGPDPRGVAVDAEGVILATRWRADENGAALYIVEDGVAEVISLEIDRFGDSDTTTGGVLNLLEEVVPSPDGTRWYLPGMHANILRGGWRNGQALDHQTSLRAVLSTVSAARRSESAVERKQLDERGRTIALATAAERLFLLHPGVGAVTILSASDQQIVGSIQDVGAGPTGLVASEDGQTLYVYAWLDRAVRAYDVSTSSPTLLWTAPTLTVEPLSAEILSGKRIFHDASDRRMTKAGYISCAHCHPDGRDDGLTWDFTDRGEGLRNTTSLEGRAGMAMGPLHWSGNFDEVQDFENDIREHFSGEGFLDDADWETARATLGTPKTGRSVELDALAAYLTAFDETPPSPWEGDETGASLFFARGCDSCHPPPLYTDSPDGLRHDVGTLTAASGGRLGGALDGLDSPTLLGAWATGPYLHDGSALTLADAIDAHASLPSDEVEALARFVRSL